MTFTPGWDRFTPGLVTLRHYPRDWFRHDLMAGLVLSAFLVPVGMGYAQAAGVPPINGLYATIVPLVIYAIFGPSRILVLGPDSSLVAVIAALVAVLAGGSADRAVEVASALAIATGLLILLAGLLRLGFVTELLSRPARLGYLTGIALAIIVSQLPKLFGFTIEGGRFPDEVRQVARGIAEGETNPEALLIGVAALVAILVLARFAPRVPGTLIAVVGGILAVVLLNADVEVVGPLPQGLPHFVVPRVTAGELPDLLAAAVAIALIATADTSVLSQSLASRRKEEVDADQELVALGAANLGTGLFQGFPISASASRTPVAMEAGARSQLTPLIGAAAVAVMIVALPDLLRNLPQSVLAAVVIAAVIRLVQPREIRELWRMRRVEFYLWLAAFLGVVLLGVLIGVGLAVVLSLVDFVRRAWRPHDAVLGRVDEMKGYHDIERYPHARQIPGLVLYRFDAPLWFANASYFRRELRALISDPDLDVRWLVVASEPITDVDTTAAEMLDDLLVEMSERGIVLAFAEMKDPVKDRLRDYGLFDRVGAEHFFPTMGTAVAGYVAVTEVDWVDWEERQEGPARQERQ